MSSIGNFLVVAPLGLLVALVLLIPTVSACPPDPIPPPIPCTQQVCGWPNHCNLSPPVPGAECEVFYVEDAGFSIANMYGQWTIAYTQWNLEWASYTVFGCP
jgi:hypothetical protein